MAGLKMRMRKIRICEDANIHENVYGVQLRMDFRMNLKAKSGLSKRECKWNNDKCV